MNVLMLLKPKSEVEFIYENNTLRQGLETMRETGYTAIPVLSKDGRYMGSVSEGDFMWYLVDHADRVFGLESCENVKVKQIMRPDWNTAVTIGVDMETLIQRAEHQNYIPVTDDVGTFIGIVTRSTIIKTFCCAENSIPVSAR